MGEAVTAGVSLEPKVFIKNVLGGSVLGSLVGRAVAAAEVKGATSPGGHKGVIYMAVGPTKIAFFAVKVGFLSNRIGKELDQFPRTAVKAVEIQKDFMPTAHIMLKDGTHYTMKCAEDNVKHLKKAQSLLNPVA